MTPTVRARLRQAFQHHCVDTSTPNYEQYVRSIEQLLHLPGQEQVVYMVCDNLNYRILYASDSVALFGFAITNPTDLAQYQALTAPEHSEYNYLSDLWHLSLHERLAPAERTHIQAVHCGIKFRRANGRLGRLLAISHFVDPDINNHPRVVLVIMQDVAHLYKGNHYWLRATFGEARQRVFHYLSHQGRTLEQDMLSAREREVLRWLDEGLDSKEVGVHLGISAETVQQHRRNMLNRTGARDTTALLQLARWCSLL